MNEDFRDLLTALNAAQARYLLVGAHAMAAHGVVRATGDMDIWVEATRENAGRVWRALEEFGAPAEALGFSVDDLQEEGTVWQIGVPPRRVDILTSIDGVGFGDAWQGRKKVLWDGLAIPALGLESLRRNKEATGREKDRLDLELLSDSKE